MLAYDMARCYSGKVDSFCQNCKRWARHPQQTWGNWTPATSCKGSDDENCMYIPIRENPNSKREQDK